MHKPLYIWSVTVHVEGTPEGEEQSICVDAWDEKDAKKQAIQYYRKWEHVEVTVISVEYADR